MEKRYYVVPRITTAELDEIDNKAFVKPDRIYYREVNVWHSMRAGLLRGMFTGKNESNSSSVSLSGITK